MAILRKPGLIEDDLTRRQREKPIAALTSTLQPKQGNPLGTIAAAATTQANDPYAYRNKSWQDQLGMFQNDSALAKTELDRATKQADLYKALGQNDNYNNAQKWIGQLHTVTGNSLLNSPDKRMEGLYGQIDGLKTQAAEKPAAFSYDPINDPQYQAALRLAQMNAQQAAGDISADMNKRGLLNSTITADRGNQAAQREYGRVSSEVVPTLMQQAYGRHMDQQQLQRQAILDQLGMLGMEDDLIGREQDVAYRDKTFDRGVLESDRAYDRNVLESDRNFDFTKDRAARQDFESDRGFDRGVFESDRGFNRGVLESNRNYNLAKGASDRASSNEDWNRKMEIWRATGKAPEGISGVAPGTTYGQKEAEKASISEGLAIYGATGQMPDWMSQYGVNVSGLNNSTTKAEIEGLYAELTSGNLTPDAALKRLDDAGRLGLKDPKVIDELRNTIYMLSPESDPKVQEQMKAEQKARQQNRAEGFGEFFTPNFNFTDPVGAWKKRVEQLRKIFGG